MQNNRQPIYKRVILKFSGEALAGSTKYGIDPKILDRLAKEVGDLIKIKVQLGIVIGGGNFFRGHLLSAAGIGRITGDHMGMLSTLINALAMRDAFERAGFATRIMSAIPMSGIVDHYDRRKALYHLNEGRIVIFAGGTGNPLVTTDSAASLRAIEVDANVLLKATNVDGIYDCDPRDNPQAKLYTRISFKEALDKELGVMDLNAFTQCRDHHVPVRVFNLNKEGIIFKIVTGESEGTLVE